MVDLSLASQMASSIVETLMSHCQGGKNDDFTKRAIGEVNQLATIVVNVINLIL